MKQHEFIWLICNTSATHINQTENGVTDVSLRSNISLSHDYKNKDRMTIKFSEDNTSFVIPNREKLEFILKLHLTNQNLTDVLRKFCNAELMVL